MLRYAGMTQADYDRVEQVLQRNDKPAPGEVLSLVGPVDGGWQVVDVWESPEVFEAYMRDTVQAVLQQLGLRAPEVTVFPLYDLQIRI
jgi:hypothetical protein